MDNDKVAAASQGMMGCAGAGCMLYLIGFVLFIIAIVVFAMISTPNPY